MVFQLQGRYLVLHIIDLEILVQKVILQGFIYVTEMSVRGGLRDRGFNRGLNGTIRIGLKLLLFQYCLIWRC